VGVGRRITLKQIFAQKNWKTWTEFMWLGKRDKNPSLQKVSEPPNSVKFSVFLE